MKQSKIKFTADYRMLLPIIRNSDAEITQSSLLNLSYQSGLLEMYLKFSQDAIYASPKSKISIKPIQAIALSICIQHFLQRIDEKDFPYEYAELTRISFEIAPQLDNYKHQLQYIVNNNINN